MCECLCNTWLEIPDGICGWAAQPACPTASFQTASRWDLLPVLDAVCSAVILTFILTFTLQCISTLGWDSLGLNLQGKADSLRGTLPPHFQGSH